MQLHMYNGREVLDLQDFAHATTISALVAMVYAIYYLWILSLQLMSKGILWLWNMKIESFHIEEL